MKNPFSQIGGLLGLGTILALVAFAIRPDALPWDREEGEIQLDEALALESVLWVDARAPEDFAAGTYAGAISVNEDEWEVGFDGLLQHWNPDATIVVFCSSQSCLRSHHVAERLKEELGIEEVYALRGGWEAMQEAGLMR